MNPQNFLGVALSCGLYIGMLMGMERTTGEPYMIGYEYQEIPVSKLPVERVKVATVDDGCYSGLIGKTVEVVGTLRDTWHLDYAPNAAAVIRYIHQSPSENGVTFYGMMPSGDWVCFHSSWLNNPTQERSEFGTIGNYMNVCGGPMPEYIGKKVLLVFHEYSPFGMKWGEENLLKYKQGILALDVYESYCRSHIPCPMSMSHGNCIYFVKYQDKFYCLYSEWSPELRREVLPFRQLNEFAFQVH